MQAILYYLLLFYLVANSQNCSCYPSPSWLKQRVREAFKPNKGKAVLR
jgi:hypothetical protein